MGVILVTGKRTGCCRGNASHQQSAMAAPASPCRMANCDGQTSNCQIAWPGPKSQAGQAIPYVPSMGMPSFHQDSFAGGLLELESQMMAASMPGRSSSGSMRILTVSGATERAHTPVDIKKGRRSR